VALHRRSSRDLCWIAAEAVAIDLHGVAAGIHTGRWEELQNLRTVVKASGAMASQRSGNGG